MWRKIVCISGIVVFILSLGLGSYLNGVRNQAMARDEEETVFAAIGVDGPPFCVWQVSPPSRVMTEEESQVIEIQTSNPEDKECVTFLTVQAPGFDLSPHEEERKIVLLPKGNGSIAWVIVPHKSGDYQVIVSDILNTKIFGITVTNVLGLSAFWAKFLTAVGGVFGPMLTVPWWWSELSKRRKSKEE